MASLELLSDDELCNKLREHGILSPVTASTRGVLIKKLNHIIARTKLQSKKASLNSFSSDDEDMFSVESTKPTRARNRRHQSYKETVDSSFSSNNKVTVRNTLNRPQASTWGLPQNENENSILKKPTIHCSSRNKLQVNNPSALVQRRTSPRNKAVEAETSSVFPVSLASTLSNASTVTYDTGSDSDIPDDYVRKWSKHSKPYVNSSSRNGSVTSVFNDNNSKDRNSVDDCSGTTKFDPHGRSGEFQQRPPFENRYRDASHKYTNITDSIVAHDPWPPLKIANGKTPSTFRSTFNLSSPNEEMVSWLHTVPFMLLVLLGSFFGIVGLCYINMHTPLVYLFQIFPAFLFHFLEKIQTLLSLSWPPVTKEAVDLQVLDRSDTVIPSLPGSQVISLRLSNGIFPPCQDGKQHDCVTLNELRSAKALLSIAQQLLLPALVRHEGSYQCGYEANQFLSMEQLKNVIRPHWSSLKSEIDLEHSVIGLAKLVFYNKHLDVGMQSHFCSKTGAFLGLSSSHRSTQILCHLLALAYFLLYSVGVGLLFCFSLWLIMRVVKHRKKQKETFEHEVFELVDKILEILESCESSGGYTKDFVVVNHIRDFLLPPKDRCSKNIIWEKAVSFIDNNDSRVHREIRTIAGEDTEVWRWIPGASVSPSASSTKVDSRLLEKTWQGQAFDSLEKTLNYPLVSPTSCLKIRNMFDCDVEFGDHWPTRIQDSILEKCEGLCIVHMAVDRTSREGLVYMKCINPKEAGRAFKALHGCWYDGNLVTVKYLREERYRDKFPSSIGVTTCLTPSNSKKLSLRGVPSTGRQ